MADDERAWSIYYVDRIVDGRSRGEWEKAPRGGVQVVVLWERPARGERRWTRVEDRKLWTGIDVYDPFGYGAKFGTWIERADYDRVWDLAAYGDARFRS